MSFETPVLDPLAGKVFFGDGFRLYIQIAGQGVQVKLAGDVKLDPSTGQITTVFDNLPQVPFTKFALSFNGGPHAVLANPPTCGTKDLSATLTPWSGTAPKVATATLTIDQGCALAFAPSLTVSATSTAAGRPAGAVTMTVGRSDSDQNLARVTTNLPPGLAGSLKGVPVCPDANADAGTCPANSQVGTVSALAGTGDAPVPLSGTVSLTGPTDGGLAGLAIALPGKVGPVDLGTVAIRAAILLRPDGGLTVKTRPIPQILGGIPIAIKQLALTLNRPGFILNASSCALQQVTADLEGASGATTSVARAVPGDRLRRPAVHAQARGHDRQARRHRQGRLSAAQHGRHRPERQLVDRTRRGHAPEPARRRPEAAGRRLPRREVHRGHVPEDVGDRHDEREHAAAARTRSAAP